MPPADTAAQASSRARTKIRIVPHGTEHREAVEAFNLRMREGGSRWGFYVDPMCTWIPPLPGRRVWRDLYLAIEGSDTVRGGYALKPQPWYIRGQERTVADWQGPFSEGAIDNKYAAMGLRMVRDMVNRQPLMYSWGHGGSDEPIVQLLRKLGWPMHDTPFLLYVRNPFRFLRRNGLLRSSATRRLVLDVLAFTGAGSIGLRALQHALRLRSRLNARRLGVPALDVEVVPQFGAWADQLWERAKDRYSALAVRDADIMNTLLPGGGWPRAIRLRMYRGDATIGWAAVMNTQMQDDARFGSLRVGSVIDCFALPEDAAAVVAAAQRHLDGLGADVIVSNQSHPAWIEGFERSGFAKLENRRIFACSPQMAATMEPFDQAVLGLHLTNLDGHGPHLL